MKCGFSCEHREGFTISTMCRVLGVSVSGYYGWRKRLKGKRAQENELLLSKTQTLRQGSRNQ